MKIITRSHHILLQEKQNKRVSRPTAAHYNSYPGNIDKLKFGVSTEYWMKPGGTSLVLCY